MHYFKYYFSAVQQRFSNLLASEPTESIFHFAIHSSYYDDWAAVLPAACLILDVHGFSYLVSFLHYPKFGGTFW